MADDPVDEGGTLELFYCRACRFRLAVSVAAFIDHSISLRGKVVKTGICKICYNKFFKISADDVLDVRLAMEDDSFFDHVRDSPTRSDINR